MGKTGRPAYAAAALPLFIIFALYALWPLGTSSQPLDHADTLFNTWLIQWNLHAVVSGENPLNLPIFSGFPDGQGRNDLLITQSLAAAPLAIAGMEPVRIHNLLLVLFLSFAGFAAALLTFETGGSTFAGIFAGSAVILLPWFQSHLWHVQLFSAGLSILAVYYALRTAEGKSSGWQIALFILLQCLASLYLWFFLNIAILLLLPFLIQKQRRKKIASVAGWFAAGNLLCTPFLLQHFSHAGNWSADSITSTDAAAFISPWSSSVLLGWLRPEGMHPEAALWPGLAVTAGFLWFLFKGKKNWTDGYMILCAVVFAVISLGPTLVVFGRELAPAPFRLLAGLPGASSIRLPARGALFTLAVMAVMAGKKLSARPLLAVLGIILAAAGVFHKPIETTPLEAQPWHGWIGKQNFSRVIYLPVSDNLTRPETEALRLMGSIEHFTGSVNGYSTSLPEEYSHVAEVLNGWPSPEARRMVEAFEADCIIIEGWQPFNADTVFHRGRLTVSAVVTGNR